MAELLSPEHHQYVTKVGGICEKLSFAPNTSAPGAAVLVRYEDDAHFGVDKVIGAGKEDNAASSRGCVGPQCTESEAWEGDHTDPRHHKQRCPAGLVVTGVITHSGDWLDAIQYVCSPLHLVSEAQLQEREAVAAAAAAAEAAAEAEAEAAALQALIDLANQG